MLGAAMLERGREELRSLGVRARAGGRAACLRGGLHHARPVACTERMVGDDGGIAVRSGVVGVDQPAVQARFRAGRMTLDTASRHRSWRNATPRALRRIRLASSRVAQRGQRDAEPGQQMVRDRTRRARQQVQQIPCGDVQFGGAGQYRVTHRGRQRVAGVVQHFADVEGVSAGDRRAATPRRRAAPRPEPPRHSGSVAPAPPWRRAASGPRRRAATASGWWARSPRRGPYRSRTTASSAPGAVRTEAGRWSPWSAQCRSSSTSTVGLSSNSSNTALKMSCGWSPSRSSARVSAANWPAKSCRGPSGRGIVSGSHAPHSTRSPTTQCSTNVSTNDVLPAPDSPHTSTAPPWPERASSARDDSADISCSRSVSSTGADATRPISP